MNRTLRVCVLVAVIVLAVMLFSLSSSIGQDRKPYEVQTRVYGVEAGRSDTARAVDAYERLMERYMDQSERRFDRLDARIEALDRTLAALDAKLAALDNRLARIEQHLGIKLAAPAPDPNHPAQPTPIVPKPDARQ